VLKLVERPDVAAVAAEVHHLLGQALAAI